MNLWLLGAALLSGGTALVHTFLGGPDVATPVLESALPDGPKLTAYYVWHMVTLLLFAMGFAFAYAAAVPSGRDVAILLTLLSALFAAWSGVLVTWKRTSPWLLPQWALFLPIAAVGTAGVVCV